MLSGLIAKVTGLDASTEIHLSSDADAADVASASRVADVAAGGVVATTGVHRTSSGSIDEDTYATSSEEVVQRAVLAALSAEGLKKTAACMREELGFTDGDSLEVSAASPEESLRALLQPGVLPAEIAALLRRSLHADIKPSPELSLATSAENMAEQRRGLERLHRKVKTLREEGHQWGPPAEPSENVSAARDTLSTELARCDYEIETLRQGLEAKRVAEAALRQRLKEAREEAANMRRHRTIQPVATGGKDAEKIRHILATWDAPGGARRSAAHCFAKVDTNHDGRLEWNNDEIRTFVKNIFKHLGVPIPPWQDPIWYELYRRCDVDNSYSLDLEESFKFARICLETALHSLDPALLVTDAPPAETVQEAASASTRRATDPPGSSFEAKTVSKSGSWSARRLPGNEPTWWDKSASQSSPVLVGVATRSDKNEFAAAASTDATSLTLAEALPPPTQQIKKAVEAALMADVEAQQQLRECGERCFGEIDGDGDGLLSWEGDEIRKFVARLFEAYNVPSPPWQPLVWDELYRACALDSSTPVDFPDAYKLAKHCFELRGYEGPDV